MMKTGAQTCESARKKFICYFLIGGTNKIVDKISKTHSTYFHKRQKRSKIFV